MKVNVVYATKLKDEKIGKKAESEFDTKGLLFFETAAWIGFTFSVILYVLYESWVAQE